MLLLAPILLLLLPVTHRVFDTAGGCAYPCSPTSGHSVFSRSPNPSSWDARPNAMLVPVFRLKLSRFEQFATPVASLPSGASMMHSTRPPQGCMIGASPVGIVPSQSSISRRDIIPYCVLRKCVTFILNPRSRRNSMSLIFICSFVMLLCCVTVSFVRGSPAPLTDTGPRWRAVRLYRSAPPIFGDSNRSPHIPHGICRMYPHPLSLRYGDENRTSFYPTSVLTRRGRNLSVAQLFLSLLHFWIWVPVNRDECSIQSGYVSTFLLHMRDGD